MITPVTDHPGKTPTDASPTTSKRRQLVQRTLALVLRTTDARLCPPKTLPTQDIHRVLVCRPNHQLGNTVLISPLLRELETLYPGAEIDLVVTGNTAQALYGSLFHVGHIFSLPRRVARHPWAAAKQLRELRRNTYDLAIDPCGTSHSGQLLLGWCRARYRVGFPMFAAHADEVGTTEPRHLAKRGVHVLRRAYAGSHSAHWPTLLFRLCVSELQRAKQVLAMILDSADDGIGTQPVFGIFANATGRKCFSEAWWQAFVDVIRSRWPGVRIVNVLAEGGRSQLPGTSASFYTGDLRKLGAMIANMSGFVSADCDVIHLAAAVGTPTLGLFALNDRDKYTPYGNGNCGIDVGAHDGGAQTARSAANWIDETIRARNAPPYRTQTINRARGTPA